MGDMPASAEPDWVDAQQVAQLFAVSVRTVRRWTADGTIPPTAYRRLGHKTLRFDVNRVHQAVSSPQPGWVDAQQVAETFGVSLKTVRRWTASGRIPSHPIGPKPFVFFDLSKVAEALRDR